MQLGSNFSWYGMQELSSNYIAGYDGPWFHLQVPFVLVSSNLPSALLGKMEPGSTLQAWNCMYFPTHLHMCSPTAVLLQ